jgi:hypothetical protein
VLTALVGRVGESVTVLRAVPTGELELRDAFLGAHHLEGGEDFLVVFFRQHKAMCACARCKGRGECAGQDAGLEGEVERLVGPFECEFVG